MGHDPVDGPVAVAPPALPQVHLFQRVFEGLGLPRRPEAPLLAAAFSQQKIAEQSQVPALHFLRAHRGGHLIAKIGLDPKRDGVRISVFYLQLSSRIIFRVAFCSCFFTALPRHLNVILTNRYTKDTFYLAFCQYGVNGT